MHSSGATDEEDPNAYVGYYTVFCFCKPVNLITVNGETRCDRCGHIWTKEGKGS